MAGISSRQRFQKRLDDRRCIDRSQLEKCSDLIAAAAARKIGHTSESDKGFVVGVGDVGNSRAFRVEHGSLECFSHIFPECPVIHEGLSRYTVSADNDSWPVLEALVARCTLYERCRHACVPCDSDKLPIDLEPRYPLDFARPRGELHGLREDHAEIWNLAIGKIW